MECKYCKKHISATSATSAHLRRCTEYEIWKDTNLTYDFLYEEYITHGKSANQIASEMGFASSTAINRRISKLNIPKRGISDSQQMPKCIQRYRATNTERWGVAHNFMKDHPSRLKWEQRLWDDEGITNVFQREDVKLKIADRIKKIGGSGIRGSRISQLHAYIFAMLVDHGIACENEFPIRYSSKYLKFYDIKVLDSNLLFEINGDLFHANPRLYKDTDALYFPGSQTKVYAADLWDRDAQKTAIANDNGYTVIPIWEYDIHKNHLNVITTVTSAIELHTNEKIKINQNYQNFKQFKKIRYSSK